MIIGIDVGGTHTDGVLLDGTDVIKKAKLPTLRENLFHSIIETLKCLVSDQNKKNIERIVLSTTLTTNAIVNEKTSKAGVIVSSGPGIDPRNYKCGDSFAIVKGALDHRGREIETLDSMEIEKTALKMKSLGIKNLAVVSKFSPRNPSHENIKEKISKPFFNKVFKGHNISGRLNFPRRINTTLLNAMIYDEHKLFFDSVVKSIKEMGINSKIHILKADGGTMPVEESIDFPAQTILSGPGASIMGAIPWSGKEDTIVLDIGGTTTDIAVLINKSPVLANDGISINNMKTLIRALETRSIGAGGDSFVRVENGELKTGPERKDKAMAFGGGYPTITDAFACLGMLDKADKKRAVKGISEIAKELDLSVEETSEKIIETCAKKITKGFNDLVWEINNKPVYTLHEFFEGYEIKPDKIKVLGAPAKAFVEYIEKVSGIKTEYVPDYEVANAKGAAMAKPTCSITFFADTAMQKAYAPEENYEEKIPANYTIEEAFEKARELLLKKAEKMESDAGPEDIEVIENIFFNMVRGYSSAGKNIRLTLQLKPGLVSENF